MGSCSMAMMMVMGWGVREEGRGRGREMRGRQGMRWRLPGWRSALPCRSHRAEFTTVCSTVRGAKKRRAREREEGKEPTRRSSQRAEPPQVELLQHRAMRPKERADYGRPAAPTPTPSAPLHLVPAPDRRESFSRRLPADVGLHTHGESPQGIAQDVLYLLDASRSREGLQEAL